MDLFYTPQINAYSLVVMAVAFSGGFLIGGTKGLISKEYFLYYLLCGSTSITGHYLLQLW